jgi:hypothetical protein
MQIKVFKSLSDIPDSIINQCSFPATQDFFLSLDWYSCLYETSLCESMSPRIYCLMEDNQRPIGMLFCGASKGKRTLYSLTNFYTMVFAPVSLSHPGLSSEYIEHMIEYIRCEEPRWNTVNFRFMLKQLPGTTHIEESFRKKAFFVSSFLMYENWYVEPSGRDFDAYYSGLSSRLKNTITRKEKKLKKAHGYEIQIHTELGPQLKKATEDYVAIYNKSWKNPEPFPAFIPRLIAVTSELGILRLGILYIDDKPAAAQLWITTNSKALIYKLAYDDEFSAFSPGSILSRELFRYAIDIDHVKEIDYGVGSDNYKKDWMTDVRELYGMQAHNIRTVVGLSLSASESAKSLAKAIKGRFL